MAVDAWAVTGAVASVVAAVGVVWERWHYVKNRPRPDIRVKIVGENPLAALGWGNGKYQGLVKNWGTEDALAVSVHGWHCTIRPGNEPEDPLLKPQETMRFTLDVDPNDLERAWVTVMWHTPSSATHVRVAWFPVDYDGALAEVLAQQVDRSWLRRNLVNWLLRQRYPSPLTRPSARIRAGMPQSPKQAKAMYGSKPPAAWRRWLGVRLDGAMPPIAFAATEDLPMPEH